MFKFNTKLFYWKNRVQKDGTAALYIEVYISWKGGNDREYFPINLSWPAHLIDRDNAKLKPRHRGDAEANDYNLIILSERNKYNDVATSYRLAKRFLTVELMKREILYHDPTFSVMTFFEKRRKEMYRLKEISEQTYKNWGSTMKSVKEFRPGLTWPEVNLMFMREYVAWLKKRQKSTGEALKPNTIWTRLKDLKSFFRVATKEINIFVHEEVLDFTNTYIEEEAVYLDSKEIIRLIQVFDESLSDTHYKVLRAFLFACFTGIRISDLYRSSYSWMISDNYMKFTMKKNGEKKPKTITIPLIPLAKSLLGEHFGKFFELPTQQEYNRSLKDLMRISGVKKHVSSHTARHTFGYLFMKFAGDIFALNKILGHSKIETTMKYAHTDNETNYTKTLQIQSGFEAVNKVRVMVR